MSNKYGIPKEVEQRIRARDKKCVYCSTLMKKFNIKGPRSKMATIEHLREKGPFYWKLGLKEKDLTICCWSCNASRGVKPLLRWFKASYCISRSINAKSVAKPVKGFLRANK
jgi:hypothetical protein